MTLKIMPVLGLTLTHLRGKQLEKCLEKFEAVEMELFRYQSFTGGEFIAKLGQEEFLVNHSGFNADFLETQQYAFQRGDAVFKLSGSWLGLMSEVCIHDFRMTRPGDFLMVLVAGVAVWMLVPEPDGDLILGCDPTFGDYLYGTLQRQINVSPFLNSGVSA